VVGVLRVAFSRLDDLDWVGRGLIVPEVEVLLPVVGSGSLVGGAGGGVSGMGPGVDSVACESEMLIG
jgi:hypothetical protein